MAEQRAHRPSEVEKPTQRAAAPTHERSFGGMAGGDPFAGAQTPGMDRLDQMAEPKKAAPDGLGKMAKGVGSARRDMTTPAAPPSPTKRAHGTR